MRDMYQEITDRIIAELSAGAAPWVRPWVQSAPHAGMPFNVSTGKAYRGINALILGLDFSFPTQGWITFNQARAMGGWIRKGEKSSARVVFYKQCAYADKDDPARIRTFPLLKESAVFNAAQCEGLDLPEVSADAAPVASNIPAADALLAQASIQIGGDTACYIPSADLIRLPAKGAFRTESDYYATALHELTHWTGHASRLDRLRTLARFGSEAYAREELIAELGAAFLCGSLGIPGKLQHAAYVGNWLQVLKGDKRAIVTAAGAAQKACDLIRGESIAADTSAS